MSKCRFFTMCTCRTVLYIDLYIDLYICLCIWAHEKKILTPLFQNKQDIFLLMLSFVAWDNNMIKS